MEESDKVCHFLLTMPECYGNVVTAMETVSVQREINLEFVKTCLLDGEIKQGDNRITLTTEEAVSTTSKRSVANVTKRVINHLSVVRRDLIIVEATTVAIINPMLHEPKHKITDITSL